MTEASLTSDAFVAGLFQHSWRGLAGLSPLTFSEGVRKLREFMRLEFHVEWSGQTRPPTMGGGGGGDS